MNNGERGSGLPFPPVPHAKPRGDIKDIKSLDNATNPRGGIAQEA